MSYNKESLAVASTMQKRTAKYCRRIKVHKKNGVAA
jgi:hypothetical protein